MADIPAAPHHHPSPHRDRVSDAALLLALALGPASWAATLMLGYAAASHACYPADTPVATLPPGWNDLRGALVALDIACLGAALLGVGIAHRAWRATRAEKAGSPHALLDVGEGRSRFLALCGVLAGLGFALAIIFNIAVAAGVPACLGLGA